MTLYILASSILLLLVSDLLAVPLQDGSRANGDYEEQIEETKARLASLSSQLAEEALKQPSTQVSQVQTGVEGTSDVNAPTENAKGKITFLTNQLGGDPAQRQRRHTTYTTGNGYTQSAAVCKYGEQCLLPEGSYFVMPEDLVFKVYMNRGSVSGTPPNPQRMWSYVSNVYPQDQVTGAPQGQSVLIQPTTSQGPTTVVEQSTDITPRDTQPTPEVVANSQLGPALAAVDQQPSVVSEQYPAPTQSFVQPETTTVQPEQQVSTVVQSEQQVSSTTVQPEQQVSTVVVPEQSVSTVVVPEQPASTFVAPSSQPAYQTVQPTQVVTEQPVSTVVVPEQPASTFVAPSSQPAYQTVQPTQVVTEQPVQTISPVQPVQPIADERATRDDSTTLIHNHESYENEKEVFKPTLELSLAPTLELSEDKTTQIIPRSETVIAGVPQTQYVASGVPQTQYAATGVPQTQYVATGVPQSQYVSTSDLENCPIKLVLHDSHESVPDWDGLQIGDQYVSKATLCTSFLRNPVSITV